MFKKNLWVAALFLAVAMIFTGCLDPLEPPTKEGLVETTVLDLGAVLQDLPVGAIRSQAVFEALFAGLPLQQAGANPGQVTFDIEESGGKNVLKVTGLATWGAGLDLRHEDIQFAADDTIYIKGSVVSGGNLFLNKNPGAGVAKVGEWEHTGNTAFEKTVTVSAADVTSIAGSSPPCVRIRANADAVFIIEELKIVGLREADFGGEGGGEGSTDYIVPDGGIDANGSEYFFLDLSQMTFGTTAAAPSIAEDAVEFGRLSTKVTFTANNTRANFKVSSDQVAKMITGSGLLVEMEGEAVAGAGGSDSFRYHFGDPTAGGSWNSTTTASVPTGTFASVKTEKTLAWQAGQVDAARLGHLIFNYQGSAATAGTVVTLSSIKVTVVPPNFVPPSAVITVSAPVAGWEGSTIAVTSTTIDGKVIAWSPALLTGGKFDVSQAYTATIVLSAKAGYTLDGWGNATEFMVNGASNKTYNAVTKRITVAFSATGPANVPYIPDGAGDADLNATYEEDDDYVSTVYSLTTTTATTMSDRFVGAGGSGAYVNGGINVTLDGNDTWRGIDIKLTGLTLTPVTKKYKVTVYGFIIGVGAGSIKLDNHTGPDYPDTTGLSNAYALTGVAYEEFKTSGEIPATWLSGVDGSATPQTAIRINGITNGAGFRISLIEIEDIGDR